MSSDELVFIQTLRENGFEGHLDPVMFQSVPRHLMKWLSKNINSSVLLKSDELLWLEDLDRENLHTSGTSEIDSSGFSCSRKWSTSESSITLSETDDSDIISNNCGLEDVNEDNSGDDEEIRALKKEIRAEEEKNLMLRQLKDSMAKKLVEVNEEMHTEERKKNNVMKELTASTDQLCALYKDLGAAFQRLVQKGKQVSAVLGSGDCKDKKFFHQEIGKTLEENFKKFLEIVEKFVKQQKHKVLIPVNEGEKFLFDSAPAEILFDCPEEQRVEIVTEELSNLIPRMADLYQGKLAADCAALVLPAAEKVLTDMQVGKYKFTLAEFESKTEELQREAAKLEIEVEELSHSAFRAAELHVQAQLLPLLLSSAKELMRNFAIKQQAQERFKTCIESYFCTLILLHSILTHQYNSISHMMSFICETHQYISSQDSQALIRMDLMHKLQDQYRNERVQEASNNLLLRTFQKLLLGEDELNIATVDATLDLMSASFNQLKAQNTLAVEDNYSSMITKNITVLLENIKEMESLSGYLLSQESISGFPLVVYNLNDQFATAKASVENFIKQKELFKNTFNAKTDKSNQNFQKNELTAWVKFLTHRKHIQDESFLDSTYSDRSLFETTGKRDVYMND